MKINRFDSAITKLYNAYINGILNPDSMKYCVAGTICNYQTTWSYMTDDHKSSKLNALGKFHQNFGKRFQGYTPKELLAIEARFLDACNYHEFTGKQKRNLFQDKDIIFNGLIATVTYLCELEGISDMMSIDKTIQYFRNNSSQLIEFSTKKKLIKN